MQPGNRAENSRRVQRVGRREFLQFVRQHIEQDLGVGVGVDVPPVNAEHFAFQLFGIGQVAVMRQRDPKRSVDVERLRLLGIGGRPGGWITNMGNTRIAGEIAHIAGTEDLPHHAVAFPHGKVAACAGGNACGVLTAMLQQLQGVV